MCKCDFVIIVSKWWVWCSSAGSLRAHLHMVGMLRLCLWPKPTELAHSFFFCSSVCFCLYGPFKCKCISFHKFSPQLSVFLLCSFNFISALLVLSTSRLRMKVSLSPDTIPGVWLGPKHQFRNHLFKTQLSRVPVTTEMLEMFFLKYIWMYHSNTHFWVTGYRISTRIWGKKLIEVSSCSW